MTDTKGLTVLLEYPVTRVDLRHEHLLALVTDIEIASEAGLVQESREELVDGLLELVAREWVGETQLMNTIEYPARDAHLADHERLALKLADAVATCTQDAATNLGPLIACIRDWLSGHASTMDADLASHRMLSGSDLTGEI